VRYKDLAADPETPIRLNRFLANAGVCSRRDADTFIQVGLVKVNDTVVTELGTKVMLTDEVKFKNRVVKMEDKIYVLLNKPKGYITTCEDPQNRKTVMDLVRGACTERIYSVGRLDRNTTGVLLLTNDGELASRLTHP
jgi:23S rRNA pseudouridine2605 synthase